MFLVQFLLESIGHPATRMATGSPGPAVLLACFCAQLGLLFIGSSISGTSGPPPTPPPAPAAPLVAECEVLPAGYSLASVAGYSCVGLLVGVGLGTLILAATSLSPGLVAGAAASVCAACIGRKVDGNVFLKDRYEGFSEGGDDQGSTDLVPLPW